MEEIRSLVASLVKDLYGVETEIKLTRTEEQFGDYATNVALQLANRLNKNSREIAEEIAGKLHHASIAKAEVAGPGFINITLSDKTLLSQATLTPLTILVGNKILVEYSDPNPFKPLHAGHLYTTLVGDMIARLVSNAGAETIRINYGGDVGLHVGKSMWAIIKHLEGENPDKLSEINEAERPNWLGQRYIEGNNAYEEDETSKPEIISTNKRVYELHASSDHESQFAQIYWACRKWSYDYFAQLYEQLGVVPFDRFIPESEVTALGVATVQEQLAKGVFERSDGAVIFDGEKHSLHKRVFINSEGLPTYETKDIGLSLRKWQDYQFDRSIIITASEQGQYMQVVLKSLEQIAPELVRRTTHLTHGVVKLQGGVKMSSRLGNIVTAQEIIEAAREAGKATGTNPNEQTILAAIKYAFARNRIGGDIVYNPVESIALEGNSGPYLQYAHARARSILHKTQNTMEDRGSKTEELEKEERTLLRKIGEASDVIAQATDELMPHYICTYLYELAQTFNRFYENNRVIGDEREVLRLELVKNYADTLQHGLGLLGIHAPDKM
ncbi:arginine--tRNA ligase [Candidatus Saccharibacteria bacterium]|nr:arginine--tRNA ligase [Candidatus Saccharibacteria bacterium]